MNKITFDKTIFNVDAIKRALINYSNDLYFSISQDDNNYLVEYENKNNTDNTSMFIKEIKNKVLEEDVRIKIEEKTGYIRNMMYEKAMEIVETKEDEQKI